MSSPPRWIREENSPTTGFSLPSRYSVKNLSLSLSLFLSVFPFSLFFSLFSLFRTLYSSLAERRKRETDVTCTGRRHSNHVSVFFSVAGAAQGQGEKENENLEPIVNGVEWKRSVSAVFPEEREPRNYRPVNRSEGSRFLLLPTRVRARSVCQKEGKNEWKEKQGMEKRKNDRTRIKIWIVRWTLGENRESGTCLEMLQLCSPRRGQVCHFETEHSAFRAIDSHRPFDGLRVTMFRRFRKWMASQPSKISIVKRYCTTWSCDWWEERACTIFWRGFDENKKKCHLFSRMITPGILPFRSMA